MGAIDRSLAVLLVVGACNRDAPPPPVVAAEAKPAPVEAKEKRSTIDDDVEPAPKPKPKPIARVPIELVPVIRSRSPLQLFATDDGTQFVLANVAAIRLTDTGPLVRDPVFAAGLVDPGPSPTVSWRATAFGGRYPESLHMVAESEGQDRFRTPQVYRFADTGWTKVENTEPPLAWSYVAFSPWTGGDSLTLRAWAPIIAPAEGEHGTLVAHGELRDRLLAKKQRAFESLRGTTVAGLPELGEHTIVAFDSSSDGHAIALAGTQMLHWIPGTTTPRVVALDPAPADARLEMFAGDDAWLLEAHGLRHYDGSAWVPVELPGEAGAQALARSADATIWVVTSGRARLLEQRAGKAWRERTLPGVAFVGDVRAHPDYWSLTGGSVDGYMSTPLERDRAAKELDLAPVGVLAMGDTLWVTARELDANDDEHWTLLHTTAREPVLELPDVETMRREVVDAAPEQPFVDQDDCEVFVPLAIKRTGGEHEDLQRKLAGLVLEPGVLVLLLEVVRDGRPLLGLLLPPGGEHDETTVATLRKAFGKRAGAPICQDMIPRRELARFSG